MVLQFLHLRFGPAVYLICPTIGMEHPKLVSEVFSKVDLGQSHFVVYFCDSLYRGRQFFLQKLHGGLPGFHTDGVFLCGWTHRRHHHYRLLFHPRYLSVFQSQENLLADPERGICDKCAWWKIHTPQSKRCAVHPK